MEDSEYPPRGTLAVVLLAMLGAFAVACALVGFVLYCVCALLILLLASDPGMFVLIVVLVAVVTCVCALQDSNMAREYREHMDGTEDDARKAWRKRHGIKTPYEKD